MSSKSSTEESNGDNDSDSECSEEGVDPRVQVSLQPRLASSTGLAQHPDTTSDFERPLPAQVNRVRKDKDFIIRTLKDEGRQVELENLNSATNEINRLELDLDNARSKFRQLLCDTTLQVDALGKKLGSCVERARPYYDARMRAKEAMLETQKAAVKFERANSAHTAAKEMVFLAEEGLKTEGRTFDHAWQEMLNHATMRVNETEMERTTTELEHRKASHLHQDAERRVHYLQKDLKRSIAKSRPYFELKSNYNQQMEEQKQRVKKLENQVAQAKASYADALRNLEQISDEIHKLRNHEMLGGFTDPLGVRGLGVGAESPLQTSKDLRKPIHAGRRKKPTKQLQQQQPQQLPRASEKQKRDNWFDSDSGDEYLSIPNKLGPAASPVMPQRMKETNDLSQYMGLSGLPVDSESRMQAVAKLEEEVLKDAKTTRLEAERRPSLATSTPSCNTTPKKTPRNPFLPLTNPFQPQNHHSNILNGSKESDSSQTWTAINLGESSSDNSPSPSKASADDVDHQGGKVDIPYRPLLENNGDDKRDGSHIITPSTDAKQNCDEWLRKTPENAVPDGGEEVWTEVSLEPETPTTSSLFKKVSFFNTNFSCARPRNSSTDDDRQSSVDLPTPPQSARGSVSLQGTPLKQRMKIDTGLVNWISRSSAADDQTVNIPHPQHGHTLGSRRQSLDTLLWNPTSERVKDIFNQGIMMLNISSLTERRSSEPRAERSSKFSGITLNPLAGMEQSSITSRPLKKIPSPLEKSLTYLNAEDDSASDTDSLHSMDMLTDDQISCLMHEPNLRQVCQDVLGTPITEVLPGYPTNQA